MVMFEDDQGYIAAEMSRLRDRIKAHISARGAEDGGAFEDFVAGAGLARDNLRTSRRLYVDEGHDLSFEFLVRRYELDADEEQMLLLAAAPHLSHNTHRLLLHAQGDLTKPHVELGFGAEVVRPQLLAQRKLTDPGSKLFEAGLIRLLKPAFAGSPSRLSRPMVAPHYVASAMLGEMRLDDDLRHCASLIAPTAEIFDVVLNVAPRQSLEALLKGLHNKAGDVLPGPLRVLLTGPEGTGKTMLARALARARRQALLSIDMSRLGPGEFDAMELARHNATFVGAVWHVEHPDALIKRASEAGRLLQKQMERFPGLVVVETTRAQDLEDSLGLRFDFRIDLDMPDAKRRRELWESAIPAEIDVDATLDLTEIARSYELSGQQIQDAVKWGIRVRAALGGGALKTEDLKEGASSQLRSRLGELTSATRVNLTMSDLVLPGDVMTEVQEFLSACRNQSRLLTQWGFGDRLVTGKGLVALFLGEAGTGKTLTAEILAGELGVTLNIVSIPKVVSKWVGETEKNLREIFSQARVNNSVLLFDEADALFARRVKVERSSDHFQNMEVNNLLQEIERFEGVVILTTNLETNMDPAFARRILYRIEFPVPGPQERSLIWRKLIPAATPVDSDVDFEMLGEDYELTGGQIKNAIVRAAYQCLAHREALTLERLVTAAQQQAMSAGRLVKRDWHS